MTAETPLSQSEYDALKYLMAAFTCLSHAKDGLDNRLKALPGGRRDAAMLATRTLRLFTSLLPTIPQKKLKMIQGELDHIELYVRMKGAAPYDSDRDDHMILPRKTVNALTKAACEQNCTLCDLKGDKVKKCPLRRLLSEALPYDLPEPEGKPCVFQVYSLEEIVQ